jgi:hypothetical protein
LTTRIARGQGLALVQGLGADFTAVVDPHQCRDMAPLGIAQFGLGQVGAGHCAAGRRRGEDGAQRLVEFRNEGIDHMDLPMSNRLRMLAEAQGVASFVGRLWIGLP